MEHSPRRSLSNWSLISSVILFLVALDQLTKYWARNYMTSDYHFLGGLFQLHLAENTGAFLSLGANWDPTHRFLFFSAGVGLFLLTVIWQLRVRRRWAEEWGLVCLLSGGIGNLIDRIYKSSVTDFMFIDLGFVHSGIFNIADMVIVAAVFLLLVPQSWTERSASHQAA